MKRTGLPLAIALILAANGLALLGVVRNQAGEPLQTIELTERELELQTGNQENSGVSLRLVVSRFPGNTPHPPLDRALLEKLGFRFPVVPPASGSRLVLLPRPAFLALECEGAAWQQWLQRAEEDVQIPPGASSQPSQEERLQRDRETMSRLFLIDAAQDALELRRRYAGQHRVMVVRATVRARIEDVKDLKTGTVTGHNVIGHVATILPAVIHVPLPHSRLLAPLGPAAAWQEPRYTVTLQYGHSLEPWVSAVKIH